MIRLPVTLLAFAAVISGFTVLLTGGEAITEPFSEVDFTDTGFAGEGLVREAFQAFVAVFIVLFNMMTLNVDGMPWFIRFVYAVPVGGAFIWVSISVILRVAELAIKFLDSIIPFTLVALFLVLAVAPASGQATTPNGDNTECVGIDFPALVGVVAAGPASFCVSYPERVSEVGDSFWLASHVTVPLLAGSGDLDIDYTLEQGCTEVGNGVGNSAAILFQQQLEWSRFILTDQTCTLLAIAIVEDAAGNALWAPLFAVTVIADDVPREHAITEIPPLTIDSWPELDLNGHLWTDGNLTSNGTTTIDSWPILDVTGGITTTVTGTITSTNTVSIDGIDPGAIQIDNIDAEVDFVSITDLWWLVLFGFCMIYGARRGKLIMALGGGAGIINEMLETPAYARAFFVFIVLVGYWADYIASYFQDRSGEE